MPILPSGYWDYLIHRYKPKEESKQYSTKKLFIPEDGSFQIVEDVDLREGVMSRFKDPRDIDGYATDKEYAAYLKKHEEAGWQIRPDEIWEQEHVINYSCDRATDHEDT